MKRILAMALMAIMVMSLGGCGNSSNNAASGTNSENTVSESVSEEGISYSVYEMEDTITDEYLEWSFEKIWNSFDLLPSDTSKFYTYYEGTEGMRYFYLQGNLKNVGTREVEINGIKVKCIFDDKYEYTGTMYTDDGNGLDVYETVAPFESKIFYMACQVPDELLETYETVTFQWGYEDLLDENEMKYHYQVSTVENRDEIAAFELWGALGGDPAEYEASVKEPAEESKEGSDTDEFKEELLEAADNSRFVRFIKLCDSDEKAFEYDSSVRELYDTVKELVQVYDGHYEVDMFAGGSYTIDLKDGIGILEFNSGAKYYVELLGWNFNGQSEEVQSAFKFTPVSDESVTAEEWFDLENSLWYYTDNMDVYTVNLDNNGGKISVMIMACEGNSFTSYNGSGIFVQD